MSTPSKRLPAIFFGHGSPMLTLDDNRYTRAWRALGDAVKPRAILCVSAHWYTRGTGVTAMTKPKTIHDFGGFPQALFDIQYPAPGNPALASRVRDLLAPVEVALDQGWGLDHGTWAVLRHAFPNADVPVVQLSIDGTKPPRFHYELAKKLAPLRDEGVLITASGNVVHNLPMMKRHDEAAAYDWAVRFNDAMRKALETRDHEALIGFERFGEDARLSVPTPDHYLPLLYIAGVQQPDEAMTIPVDGIMNGTLSMLTAVAGD